MNKKVKNVPSSFFCILDINTKSTPNFKHKSPPHSKHKEKLPDPLKKGILGQILIVDRVFLRVLIV